MNETVTLAEQNYEERKEMTDLIQKSAEDAEEIIIRKCAYDKNKVLKYRGRDAEVRRNILFRYGMFSEELLLI